MATISVSLPSDGQTIDAADYNVPINTIVSAINGGLDSNNIAASGVVPNNLTSGTGTSWAWSSWTPTLTNFAIGTGGSAGTVARYIQIGKTVHYYIKSTLGTSGQSVGTAPDFTLPVAINSTWAANSIIGHLIVDPTGGGACPGQVLNVSGKGRLLAFLDDSGTGSAYSALDNVAASAPGTWAANGYFIATGTYEVN